jgi:hypothetical protein
VDGLKISAVGEAIVKILGTPPAINTVPSGKSEAVWADRSILMLPVSVKVLVAGSNISALEADRFV